MGHDSPPAQELSFGSRDVGVLCEGTRMLPVAESKAIMVGCTAEIEDDAQYYEAGDGDDLYGCKDELAFSVDTYGRRKISECRE